jgi:uroporphyrinogen III methyltransferase / synthase
MTEPEETGLETPQRTGKVYLVGSGPGKVDYLTVQAHRLLTQAEVLVYDALVDSDLLQLVPETCQKLNVGKRGGQLSMPQSAINDQLVQYCLRGDQVIRLKSGDPFIFGRSHAEIAALTEAHCDFEVVPGLSSALAAPLLAGIPLTDPTWSHGFMVVSAHEPDALDWPILAQLDTLVILMGGRNLPMIIDHLRRCQKSPKTPIAIIRWAGHPQEEIWTGTLKTIVKQTADRRLSPCVIVIGEVVRLAPPVPVVVPPPPPTTLTTLPPPPSMPSSPLSGKTVLVTRAASQSSQFSDRLHTCQANVIDMPALEIVPPSSWDALDAAIAHLADFDWLILSSSNAVDSFFARLPMQDLDPQVLATIKIAVVGDKTARALAAYGRQPDFVPPAFVADSLAEHFPGNLDGAQILFPRVESGGRDVLVKDLTLKGAEVVEVAAYQSTCPEVIDPAALAALSQQQVDIITFASSKTVKHFCQMLERAQPDASWQAWLNSVCIASIGPQTTRACETLLGRVDAEAQEYTLDGLVIAIEQWLQSQDRPSQSPPSQESLSQELPSQELLSQAPLSEELPSQESLSQAPHSQESLSQAPPNQELPSQEPQSQDLS